MSSSQPRSFYYGTRVTVPSNTAGAGPVYRLLGKKDMGTTEFPPVEMPLIDGEIAFRQHSLGHTDAPNWPTFLRFADRYMKALTAPKITSKR